MNAVINKENRRNEQRSDLVKALALQALARKM